MWQWFLPLTALILVTPIINWYWVRHLTGVPRRMLAASALVVMLAFPWMVPAELPMARFLCLLVMGVGFGKTIETAWGRITKPVMGETFLRYCCWHLIAQDSGWALDDQARSACRQRAGRHLMVALCAGGALVGLLWLNGQVALHDNLWLSSFWMIWVFLATAEIIWRLGSVPLLWMGVEVSDLLVWPALAHSPRDFWSRRWNLWFKNVAHRNIFLPLGGGDRPLLSMSMVWIWSALLHEFMIFLCLGTHFGYMLAFFLLHGLATYVEVWWAHGRRGRPAMPRALATGVHLGWFITTAPLFFVPIGALFHLRDWGLF